MSTGNWQGLKPHGALRVTSKRYRCRVVKTLSKRQFTQRHLWPLLSLNMYCGWTTNWISYATSIGHKALLRKNSTIETIWTLMYLILSYWAITRKPVAFIPGICKTIAGDVNGRLAKFGFALLGITDKPWTSGGRGRGHWVRLTGGRLEGR